MQESVFVVAQNTGVETRNEGGEAWRRVSVESDHISQTDVIRRPLSSGIPKNGAEGFPIGMHIAQYRYFHTRYCTRGGETVNSLPWRGLFSRVARGRMPCRVRNMRRRPLPLPPIPAKTTSRAGLGPLNFVRKRTRETAGVLRSFPGVGERMRSLRERIFRGGAVFVAPFVAVQQANHKNRQAGNK